VQISGSTIRGGVAATLRAAAVPRMQVISGWDLAAKGGSGSPKPTRRLAPAGTVYFVTWEQSADVHTWLEATWMQNVSDTERDQLDGFGLAAIGVWPHINKEQQQ
jgi:CRISPR-associated protein Cmr3